MAILTYSYFSGVRSVDEEVLNQSSKRHFRNEKMPHLHLAMEVYFPLILNLLHLPAPRIMLGQSASVERKWIKCRIEVSLSLKVS